MHTYWNGEAVLARRVRVLVGWSAAPGTWCRALVGTERKAVELHYCGEVIYLDDHDGTGWAKVTAGRGSPRLGHRRLPDDSVVLDGSGALGATSARRCPHRSSARRHCRTRRG